MFRIDLEYHVLPHWNQCVRPELPSMREPPRSRATPIVLLMLGILLLIVGIAYPLLIFIGVTSCTDIFTCTSQDGLSLLGGGLLLSAFNANRKKDQAKIGA